MKIVVLALVNYIINLLLRQAWIKSAFKGCRCKAIMLSQSQGVPGGHVRRATVDCVLMPALVRFLQGVPGKQRQLFL